MAFAGNLRKIIRGKKSLKTVEHIEVKSKIENWFFIIPLGMIFVCWEIALKLNLISTETIPAPSEILEVLFVNLLTNPGFTISVLRSLANIGVGIFVAALIAIPFAIFTGLKSRVDASFTPLIMIVGALPDIALLPFLVYWFGRGASAAILMATIVAFFPIFFTVREGVKNIPKDYFHVAYIYKARKIDVYTKLILPAVFPQLVTGIRLAYEFLWEIVLAIEIIARIHGIGFIINFAVENGSLTYAFAGFFMIGIIAILLDRLVFHRLEESVRRWHE
jgi:sulfonate transport system permease protein